MWHRFGVHILGPPAWIQLLFCLHEDLSCLQLTDCIGRGFANTPISLDASISLSFLEKGLWNDGLGHTDGDHQPYFMPQWEAQFCSQAPKYCCKVALWCKRHLVLCGKLLVPISGAISSGREESFFSRDLLVQSKSDQLPESFCQLHKPQLPTSIFF